MLPARREDGKALIWVTRKALTQGVWKVMAEVEGDHASFRNKHAIFNGKITIFGEGRDWHRTEQGALDRAETLRLAEVKSLQKKLKKMEALRFTSASVLDKPIEETEETEDEE